MFVTCSLDPPYFLFLPVIFFDTILDTNERENVNTIYWQRRLRMRLLNNTFLQLFLVAEIFVFGYVYFFGKSGMQLLHELKQECASIDNEVIQLAVEIKNIEKDINDWESNDFLKERIAREQLQMARKDDKIYYVS